MEDYEVVTAIYVNKDKLWKYELRNIGRSRILYSPRKYVPGEWIKI